MKRSKPTEDLNCTNHAEFARADLPDSPHSHPVEAI